MTVIISSLSCDQPPPEALARPLTRAAELLLHEYGLEEAEVGIILADDAYLHELNRSYRGADKPTDVLAFAMLEPGELHQAAAGPDLLLGEVYISLERAAEQARDAGHSPGREVLLLGVHGLLHLIGFDHATPEEQAAMQEKEKAVLSRLE